MLKTLTREFKTCEDAYAIFIADLILKRNKTSNFLKETYLVQTAKSLIEIAWKELGRNPARLSLEKETVKIPIKKEYIKRVKSPEVKKFIRNHIKDFYYPLRTDVHVHVDGDLKSRWSVRHIQKTLC